jgi:hypothetical protein
MAGTVLGTPGWMAPEQFRGGVVGPPTDVFSWGCLVAYAATGRLPWGDEGPPAAFAYRIIHGQPDLAGLDGSVRPLVEAALGKDPARRPTARDLVLALLGGGPATNPTAAATAAATHLLSTGWAPVQPGPPGPRPPAPGGVAPRAGGVAPRAAGPGGVAPQAVGPGGVAPRVVGPRVVGPVPPGRTASVWPPTKAYGPSQVPPRPRSRPTGQPAVPPPGNRSSQLPVLPGKRLTRRSAGSAPVARPASARAPVAPAPVAPRASGRRGRGIGAPPPWQPYEQRVAEPRPRRRRWYRKKRYLLLVGLLVLLAAASSNRPDGGDGSAPSAPSASGQRGPSGQSQPGGGGQTRRAPTGVGVPVRDGQLEFVVKSWRCWVDKLSRGPLSRRARGQFCLAGVEARNIGGQARTLVEWIEKLHDTDGRTYNADVRARLFFTDQTIWDAVDPGETARGTLAFDIPVDVEPAHLELHDGVLSNGTSVPLTAG